MLKYQISAIFMHDKCCRQTFVFSYNVILEFKTLCYSLYSVSISKTSLNITKLSELLSGASAPILVS